MRFAPSSVPPLLSYVPWFGSFLPFEKIKVLRSLTPTVLHSSLLLSTALYSDDQPKQELALCMLLNSNLQLLHK